MGLRLGFFLLAIFFGLAFVVISKIHYSSKFNVQYKMRHMFPFELNYNSKFVDNFWGNFCLVMSSTCMIIFFIFYTPNHKDGVLIFITSIGILLSLLQTAVAFVPFKTLKPHLAVTVMLFALDFALSAGISIAGYRANQYEVTPLGTIVFLVGFLLALFVLGLILNPKCNAKFTYEIKKDKNGNDVYERPKFIVLALTEWMLILVLYLDMIIALVLSFVIKA